MKPSRIFTKAKSWTLPSMAQMSREPSASTPTEGLELRGPIGGYFVWDADMGGPLLLAAGGSGVVPLRAMLRHRAASSAQVAAKLIYSSRTWEDIIFREELERLGASSNGPKVNPHADDEPAARMERLWAPVQRTGP
jgi:NAD(P)H-flavin reductase